jgi:hypothetical protein
VLGRRDRQRIGRGIEQHGRDVHPGDAVDERVVSLREQREAPVGEPLHEPQLPERSAAVERLGEDPAGQPLELGLAARPGQRGMAHVVAHVEVGIVDPHGPSLVEGDEREPLAIARYEVQP